MNPTGRERILARLVGQIQTLTLELQNLRERGLQTPEVDAKERTLERLRGQLAAVAKRAANRRAREHWMTTAAISSPRTRTVGRLSTGLSVRHSLRTEAAAALTLYGLYELARGLVVADRTQADAHAHRLVALERSLHLFVESNVQRGVQTLPGLTSLLGVAYVTLHLAVTAGVRVSLGIVAAGNHFFLDEAAGVHDAEPDSSCMMQPT